MKGSEKLKVAQNAILWKNGSGLNYRPITFKSPNWQEANLTGGEGATKTKSSEKQDGELEPGNSVLALPFNSHEWSRHNFSLQYSNTSRQVTRIKKIINKGIFIWSNARFSKVTS